MDAAWVHNLDPFAIQFTESFGIRWYGLAYLSAFVGAYFTTWIMARRGTTPVTNDLIGDYITYGAIGTLAGGRIGYVLFYSPSLLTQFSSAFPYWGALEVHKGGMASHGGLLGVMFACWLFSRIHKVNLLHMFDLSVFGGSIGFLFGRLANFINGELYGRVAPEGYKWAVKFPSEIFHWGKDQAESLKQLAPAVEALGAVQLAENRTLDADTDKWFGWISRYDSWAQYNIDVIKEKLVQATQMGNEKVIEALGPVLTARYPSQLYQAAMEGFSVLVILIILWMKPRKPGVIAGVYGMLYAVMRILGEQYRLPDAHIGFDVLGLTRGQWLSVGLFFLGLFVLIYGVRQDSEPLGGWNIKFGKKEKPGA